MTVNYMYSQFSQTGFIKAFSNSVQSFTMGYGQVERVMRALFVKELYIWPRFHSVVIQSLKEHEVTTTHFFNIHKHVLVLAPNY